MEFKIISKEEFMTIKNKTFQSVWDLESGKYLLVKYTDPNFPTLHINDNGDWIDLKCFKDYELKKGESIQIDLGVAMKLPTGYEAHLVPRSGTFKKYGLIQTDGVGIIDNSYSGNNDIWKMSVYALDRDVKISKGERLCQFRLMPVMCRMSDPTISNLIVLVDKLDDKDRGGFGSTGR